MMREGLPGTAVACPECELPQIPDPHGSSPHQQCTGCRSRLRILAFPVLRHIGSAAGDATRLTLESGQAECFFHTGKAPSVICDHCGVFLCSLCAFEVENRSFCSRCLEEGRREGRLTTLKNRSVLHGHMALYLALLPPLTFIGLWLTWATAPLTLWVVFRHWNTREGIFPISRWRLAAATMLALLQIAGWILLIAAILGSRES